MKNVPNWLTIYFKLINFLSVRGPHAALVFEIADLKPENELLIIFT